MRTYDLYGDKSRSLHELKDLVENALHVAFVPHESSYWGDYYLAELDQETFRILRNKLEGGDEDDIVEPQFMNYVTLLQVQQASNPDLVKRSLLRIRGLEFLRRDEK